MASLIQSADVYLGGTIEFNPVSFNGQRNIGSVPTLYDSQGQYVRVVNQWFIHLIADKRIQGISSYANALLRYWQFLERENLVWSQFEKAKSLKPTYRFRNQDLLPSCKTGQLSYSTANAYISHMVAFYLWAARERYLKITDHHQPFEMEFVTVKNDSLLSHLTPKLVVTTTDLRIRVPRNADGVRPMNPLLPQELDVLAEGLCQQSIEFRLMCALGLQSGLRIGEAAGITVEALDTAVPTSEVGNRYSVRIGLDNGVPTKYGKTRTIEMSAVLLEHLQRYSLSERRLNRLAKQPERTGYKPLFITKLGNPYKPVSVQVLWGEFRTELQQQYPFNHRFHDLRCSYGTYRLDSLLEAGVADSAALGLLMGWLGHKDEKTTWRYLRYLRQQTAEQAKLSMLDTILHKALEEAVV